jgi:transformation/transcription domain-associated protein
MQTGQNSSQGQADERMMQLLRLLNRPLERSPESKRRNLTWYTPIIVPVWPQVKGLFCEAGGGEGWKRQREGRVRR